MSDHPEIHIIVIKVKKGETQAFSEIVDFYSGMVTATAGRFARNETDREDLSQEVFIKAYRSIRKFKGKGSFEGWLRKITVHTCLDWLRKQKRQRSMPISDLGDDIRDRFIAQIEATSDKPDDLIAQPSEMMQILQTAMERLTSEEHAIIVLKEIENRTIKEISELTGLNESNIKVKAHRARNKLKRILLGTGDKDD